MEREFSKRRLKGLKKMFERDYEKDKAMRKQRRDEKAARKKDKRRKPRRLEIVETLEQELEEFADDR